MVTKPEGIYSCKEVIELAHNREDYSIYLGRIDSGKIDGLDYTSKSLDDHQHEVFKELKQNFFHLSPAEW